ncbi:MAG: hypothetical protein J0I20_14420 [Chloroflexi bacterium]|nr:hypothetical protein [Chloroflexota bacterium]OJW02702.1 MAG: hypothetical protein BGO39_05570 [Chloroflexi bacterium 54-19]
MTTKEPNGLPTKILLQTTIEPQEDDWNINRFSLLRDHLAGLRDSKGQPLYEVTARDREAPAGQDDPVLSRLDRSDFDELWLFAVDTGDGLNKKEAAAIEKFWNDGGGLMITRDHQDLGSSVLLLGEPGSFHFFHSKNNDPDSTRCAIDDTFTTTISWPNYHSGNNGDYQEITAQEPLHDLLKKPGGQIEYFPAHPHEGAVGVPACFPDAQVIATGKSKVTGRPFNLAVVYEKPGSDGSNSRIVAESTFHHFVDYNWNLDNGCPSFLGEKPGHGIKDDPAKLDDIRQYVGNIAAWLAPTNRA